jgi:hypothetical protein
MRVVEFGPIEDVEELPPKFERHGTVFQRWRFPQDAARNGSRYSKRPEVPNRPAAASANAAGFRMRFLLGSMQLQLGSLRKGAAQVL